MGSLLDNRKKGGVWWIDPRAVRYLDGLALTPEGDRDQDPADNIQPFNVDLTYVPFLSIPLRLSGSVTRYSLSTA